MKRFHLHISVRDLDESIEFYSTLFGAQPSVCQIDYAKWMLEDPRLNTPSRCAINRPESIT